MYFAIGHYVRSQIDYWNMLDIKDKNIEMKEQAHQNDDGSDNSDNQGYSIEETPQEINWQDEFAKIRFTTPYLVYKVRKIWFIIDKFSQLIFVIISLMIMILATHWQISLSMAIHLTCFLGLCLQIAHKLYHNREKEKKSLKSMKKNEKYRLDYTIQECQTKWDEYKKIVNSYQVAIRQNIWLFQFVITLLCIALIYPSEFIFYVRKTFIDEGDHPELVNLLNYITFYLFWVGVYHCPEQGHGYFHNLYGYLIILVLLIFEKNAQQWALNRFECDETKVAWFKQIEENLAKDNKNEKKPQLPGVNEEIIEEEQEDDQDSISIIMHRKNKSNYTQSDYSHRRHHQYDDDDEIAKYNTPEDMKKYIKDWINKKYILKLLSGFKILLEETVQFLLLISSVYKDSVVGMVLLFGVFLYIVRRKIRTMQRLAWITGVCMIVQYGLALSNLTSKNNPMQFPKPFDPYPNGDDDEGEFIIPWYRKIPFLADSFPWQIYLSMGVNNSKLNSIWIDYIIMGCIQADLFYFGCQLFSINLRVKKGNIFNKYCQMITGNIYNDKEFVVKETHKLKRQCFAYNFYKGSQMSIFMHFHQITIVVTLLLAILARSLLSFGYITVCMIMIYENHKYFLPNLNNDDSKEVKKNAIKLKLDKVLKYWMQPYIFFDITIQMVFQIPIEFLHKGQDAPNSWQNIIGLQDIWVEDDGQVIEFANQSLVYIFLKAVTFYLVSLQIQVFESQSYHKYMKEDFRKQQQLAQDKGDANIKRGNNFKIQKIREQQQEQHKMDDMLKSLKQFLTQWQQKLSSVDIKQQMQLAFDQATPVSSPKAEVPPPKIRKTVTRTQSMLEEVKHKDTHRSFNEKSDKKILRSVTHNSKHNQNYKNDSIAVPITTQSSFITKDDFFVVNNKVSDHELLQNVISKLSIFVRLLIWLKKNLTDQVVFISSRQYLDRVVKEMEQGKTNIYSKLERRMLSDIKELRKRRVVEDFADIDIKLMTRTQEQTKFWRMLRQYIRLVSEIIVTYSDSVCYILMIVSMMKNAGLISIFYPIFVFGYALMEEINPGKKVWLTLMIYTQALIIAKFMFQLSFWEAFYTQQQIGRFQDKLNGIHVGLTRLSSDQFGKMFAYFLPEILILLAIMTHIQKEIMTGVLFLKDQSIEDIQTAINRYSKFNSDLFNKKVQVEQPIQVQELEQSLLLYDDLDNSLDVLKVSFQAEFQQVNIFNRRNSVPCYEPKGYEPLDFEMNAYSLVDQKYYRAFSKKKLKIPLKHKIRLLFRKIFYKNAYFERLFPSVKEQKPGRDLYALIATFQSVLCMFMIFFYTKMDADVTNISDQLTYNQFSGQMVVALFLQILVMIIDRYLYKSKTFIQVEEIENARKDKHKGQHTPINNNVTNESMKIDELQTPTKLKHEEASKDITPSKQSEQLSKPSKKLKLFDDSESSKSSDDNDQPQITFKNHYQVEKTKVTLAMVSKYYLQIFLILFVHSFVFWYFPITGNIKLQNYPYCVTKTSQNKDRIACNEFGENWALVIFYILYCCYFWVSALQIRYGVAEMKKGHFLMNSYHIVNYVAFKGFMAIPFIFELKTFIDWTFTKTALDVFQWFNLTSNHAELYIAHSLQGRMQAKPLGRPVKQISKIVLGFIGQILIILLIAGPLLLFSTFNPISTPNPVINARISFNILLEPKESSVSNTINVFTNNYVTMIKQVSDTQYDTMQFANDPKTKSFDRELIQYIKMNNFPDTSWGVSQPNKAYLREEFQQAVDNRSDTNILFQLSYEFNRQKQTIQPAKADWVYNMSEPRFRQALKNFTNIFNLDCQSGKSNTTQQVQMTNIFNGVHFLNDYDKAIPDDSEIWMKGLYIVYSCKGDYWMVDQLLNETSPEFKLPSSKTPGIAFFTFSSKTSPSYFKYSVITFYLSIVLVISKLLRNMLVIGGNRIFIFEIPRAEKLLQLCECVYIYRMRAQLDKEEQLYFTFMDIMRSPEMIKAITGSALKKKAD